MNRAQYEQMMRQMQARLREAENKRRQEINRYNQAVRQHNQKIEQGVRDYNNAVRQHNQKVDQQRRAYNQAVDAHNREVKRYNQSVAQAISRHNQQVTTHNARVRTERAALERQISALRSRPVEVRYTPVRDSTYELYQQFERAREESRSSVAHSDLVELSERESRNSVDVLNALLSDENDTKVDHSPEEDTGIIECLQDLSPDLCDRWKGAVFSLNPANPDAARHFCTSVREIFTEILETTAPDDAVVESDAACERTPQGKPSRRAKITYLLRRKGISEVELRNFIEADIKSIIELFKVFNEATHGVAGKHGFTKLQAIKKRVEDGIMFLATVAL